MKDIFGKDLHDLLNKKLFLFDMDGTIYEDSHVYQGTLELLDYIDTRGGKYMFITNNSSSSVKDYIGKLEQLGISTDDGHFLTASQATILYLQQNYPNKKVYALGTQSFLGELQRSGIMLTSHDQAELLLVGFDKELTYEKWANACQLLFTKKVPFIATNPDLSCPTSFGFIPDCGSICQILEHITNQKATYIGKPKDTMVKLALQNSGFTAEDTLVIGDRLYTDIACGNNAGVSTLCVLTGEANIASIQESDIKPTYTLTSVLELYKTLKEEP